MPLHGKQLIFPWMVKEREGRLAGFEGSRVELDAVLWQLSRLRYPYEQLNKTKPEEPVVRAVKSVLQMMEERYMKRRVPWVLVVSESMELLQALAQIVPMTLALTLKKACFNASSIQLMDLFSAARPKDDFEPDPSGELLHELTNTGLLVWELLTEQVYGTKGRAGQFAGLLTSRLSGKGAMLITCYAPEGFTDKTAGQMMKGIGERYGPTVRGLLEHEAELRHFKTRAALPKWTGEEF